MRYHCAKYRELTRLRVINNRRNTDFDVPRSTTYGVYISQIIRVARVSSHVDDFNTRNKVLTKHLRQGYS